MYFLLVDLTTPEGPSFAKALHLSDQSLPVIIIYTDGGREASFVSYSWLTTSNHDLLSWIRHTVAMNVC